MFHCSVSELSCRHSPSRCSPEHACFPPMTRFLLPALLGNFLSSVLNYGLPAPCCGPQLLGGLTCLLRPAPAAHSCPQRMGEFLAPSGCATLWFVEQDLSWDFHKAGTGKSDPCHPGASSFLSLYLFALNENSAALMCLML